jgi:hypothetical protein
MAGPWEKYQTTDMPAPDGPWMKYAQEETPTVTTEPVAVVEPPRSTMQEIRRQAGLVGRAVTQGVASLPMMAMDAGVAARNLATNLAHGETPTLADFNPFAKTGGTTQTYELPSTTFNRALTEAGVPEPSGFAEKAAGFVEAVLTGSRMPAPSPAARAPTNFVSPTTKGLTETQRRALEQGEALGMKTTPGQAKGSRPLQQVEAKLESQPWTSGPASAIKANNAEVLNKAWAKAIGEDATVVDSAVMARANDRMAQVFSAVRDQTPRAIDTQKASDTLRQINLEFEGLLPNGASVTDNALVSRLVAYADEGTATGEQLGSLTSKLGRAAAKQMTSAGGDRDLGLALFRVKDYVDDIVESGLSSEQAALYNTTRQQYRALMQLTARVGNVNPNTGNVSGASIASYLQKSDKRGFLYGGNTSDAYSATRFAQAFKPIVGDSGTATRSLGLNDLLSLPLGLPANVLSRAYYGGYLTPGAPSPEALQHFVMGSVTATTGSPEDASQ